MSNKQKKHKNDSRKAYTHIETVKDIAEFRLQNGLRVLHKEHKGTGVITTNITYKVGARNEKRGETGIAHMLEHMLFKPTKADIKKKIDSGAMQFERETGCILNANTWKDRTTYFFSYPKQYFSRALQIEADRMHGVILTDEEFQPERNNVLSEFDMYFGDPQFALSLEMVSSAFHSHPYGHETIGFREDIERYDIEMLKAFYAQHYDPSNATLMVIGDIKREEALAEVARIFGTQKTNGGPQHEAPIVEPKQQGTRRVSVTRNSPTNILGLGVKHAGFPSTDWFKVSLLSRILTSGIDSILYKKLVETGLALQVEMSVEPTQEENVALLFITLSPKTTHRKMEERVLQILSELTVQDISLAYKKVQKAMLTAEVQERESSLNVAMELTEYVSADAWEKYHDTETILRSITAKDIVSMIRTIFDTKTMTIGDFIGTKNI